MRFSKILHSITEARGRCKRGFAHGAATMAVDSISLSG
jgi:hypothetical protein